MRHLFSLSLILACTPSTRDYGMETTSCPDETCMEGGSEGGSSGSEEENPISGTTNQEEDLSSSGVDSSTSDGDLSTSTSSDPMEDTSSEVSSTGEDTSGGDESSSGSTTTGEKIPDPMCGDGILDVEEGCDDGNQSNLDGCLNNCVAATCGDGVVHQGVEQCDTTSWCADDCTFEVDECGVPLNEGMAWIAWDWSQAIQVQDAAVKTSLGGPSDWVHPDYLAPQIKLLTNQNLPTFQETGTIGALGRAVMLGFGYQGNYKGAQIWWSTEQIPEYDHVSFCVTGMTQGDVGHSLELDTVVGEPVLGMVPASPGWDTLSSTLIEGGHNVEENQISSFLFLKGPSGVPSDLMAIQALKVTFY